MAASQKTIGTHSLASASSANKCRQTSGPTPAGSPIVTAIRGREAIFAGHSLNRRERRKRRSIAVSRFKLSSFVTFVFFCSFLSGLQAVVEKLCDLLKLLGRIEQLAAVGAAVNGFK